jgi:hypothetical protein
VSASTSAIVNAQPVTPIKPAARAVQPTCTVATGSITVTSPTGTGLKYILNGTSNTDTSATGVFSTLVAGTYSVKVQNASGCIGADTSIVINIQPATPATPSITPSLSGPICSGTTVTLTSTLATTYQWYKDGSLIGGAANQTFNTVLPGSYTLIVTNSYGCYSLASSPYVLKFEPVPTASISNGTLVGLTCSQPTTLLTAPAGDGDKFEWFKDGVSLGAASLINTYAASIPGDYTVKITTASYCSDSSIATKVIAAATSSAGGTSICAGDSTYLKVNSAFTNTTYQWQISADGLTGWNNITAPGATTDSLNINYAVAAFHGTNYYKVVLVNSDNSALKDTTCPISITINSLPTVTITAASNDTEEGRAQNRRIAVSVRKK